MRALKFIALCLLSLATVARAQLPMPTAYLATVDSATQQLVLRWQASTDTTVAGYNICSGDTCRDYAIVLGRFDTTYVCTDHSPLETHIYSMHTFDTAGNASPLTPPFGNMVLQADVPECATHVDATWTAYRGMPSGLGRYRLQALREPYDTAFTTLYTTDSLGTRAYSFDMLPGTTRVMLRVEATSCDSTLVAHSNIVEVLRRTIDSASRLAIHAATYDSVANTVRLELDLDPSYTAAPYMLWRSIDGRPWSQIATMRYPDTIYLDHDINRFDSLHCYQLSVADACGLNSRYTEAFCLVVPNPPPPAIALPNAVLAGDDGPNGAFLPHIKGLMGDLYELTIYDRMGREVFFSNNPAEAWRPTTGTPQGAYTYALRLRYNDNTIHTYTGTVLVIK